MKNKKIITMIITAVLMICMVTPVFAAKADSAGNIFEADEDVTLNSIPFFGAMVAGQKVSINDSEAGGSVMEAGQEVSITSTAVGESLYIAGNIVTASDTAVLGNIYAAGNNVVIGNGTEGNGVYVAGSTVSFSGSAKALCLAGGTVTFSGKVDGDVTLEGDKVIVTEDAEVTGELKIRSANEPEVSDAATFGSYDYEQISKDEEEVAGIASKAAIGAVIWDKIKSCIYWVIAMGVFGVILCWLFNDHLINAAEMIKNKPGVMIGTGVVTWLCVPLAALILCITYILAPIGAMLAMAYVLLLCAGLAFAGASLVKLFLPNMNKYLAGFIGIAVLEIVRLIPVLGFLVGAVADMYLLAYVVQKIWSSRKNREEVLNV